MIRCLALCCALTLAACGGPEDVDAGRDAGVDDAGPGDAAVDAAFDAGPAPDPTGELALDWSLIVTSGQRLGGVAESRLAATPEGMVLSVSLGGASATFADGTPGAIVVGDDADNAVTQALGWITTEGTLSAARAVVADPVMSDFRALGWDVETLPDGTAFVGGRFEGGARFGGADPLAQTFETLRVIMEPGSIPITSSDACLARFDPSHAVVWTARGRSESPVANLRFVDVEVLADGGTLGLGVYDDPITLGDGASSERLSLGAGAERETFIARFDPVTLGDGASSERLSLGAGAERETFIARFDPDAALGPGAWYVRAPRARGLLGWVVHRVDPLRRRAGARRGRGRRDDARSSARRHALLGRGSQVRRGWTPRLGGAHGLGGDDLSGDRGAATRR